MKRELINPKGVFAHPSYTGVITVGSSALRESVGAAMLEICSLMGGCELNDARPQP